MDDSFDEKDMTMVEELFELEESGWFLNTSDNLEDWIFDFSSLPEEPRPSVNPMKTSSSDMPIDPREWLISDQTTRRQRPPRLYEFLILLLHKPHYASYALYKDRAQGVFEIYEPEKVAELWQHVKNRQSSQKMTYDKFARAIRWYYKTDIMKKTNARYTFQFSPRTLAGIMIDENNNLVINSPILDK